VSNLGSRRDEEQFRNVIPTILSIAAQVDRVTTTQDWIADTTVYIDILSLKMVRVQNSNDSILILSLNFTNLYNANFVFYSAIINCMW